MGAFPTSYFMDPMADLELIPRLGGCVAFHIHVREQFRRGWALRSTIHERDVGSRHRGKVRCWVMKAPKVWVDGLMSCWDINRPTNRNANYLVPTVIAPTRSHKYFFKGSSKVQNGSLDSFTERSRVPKHNECVVRVPTRNCLGCYMCLASCFRTTYLL